MRNTHARPEGRRRRRKLLRATAAAALGGCGSVLLGGPKADPASKRATVV